MDTVAVVTEEEIIPEFHRLNAAERVQGHRKASVV